MFSCFGKKTAAVLDALDSPLIVKAGGTKHSDIENAACNSPPGGDATGEHFLLSTAVEQDSDANARSLSGATPAGENNDVEDVTRRGARGGTATPTGVEPADNDAASPRPEPPLPPHEWSEQWRPTESSALLGGGESGVLLCLSSGPPPPPPLPRTSMGSGAAAAPEAAEMAEASDGSTSASVPGLVHVPGSQSTVTLLCPRISQLSRVLSCGGSSFLPLDDGEQVRRSSAAAGGQPPPPDYLGSAARRQVFLPRAQLAPLACPERALEDAAGLLDGTGDSSSGASSADRGSGEAMLQPGAALCALLVLRRVAIHHRAVIAHALGDLSQLLLECARAEPPVARAALLAMQDLALSFPSALVHYVEHSQPGTKMHEPGRSVLFQLLLLASTARDLAVAATARATLMALALHLPQGRIVKLLEAYIDHRHSGVRAEAGRTLVVATYRT